MNYCRYHCAYHYLLFMRIGERERELQERMRVFTEQRIDSLHEFADFTNQYIFFINSKQALPVIFV